jgi:hypothetical protein
VVLLQDMNQFSKPSTEMELIQWAHAAISPTCEQDRCVCVWFCITCHEDMAAL